MWKRLSVLWAVVRGDAKLLWLALKHPQSPGWLKPAVGLMALYLLSPVDLIPDVIPVLGLVDDVVLIPLAIRFVLKRLPVRVRADIRADPKADYQTDKQADKQTDKQADKQAGTFRP